MTGTDRTAATKYLLLDDRIIGHVIGGRLALGSVQKHPTNPLFGEDKPWEVRFDNLYPNVLLDVDGLYKCWYSPFIIDERTSLTPAEMRGKVSYIDAKPNAREMGVCYAMSKDGLHWEKPELGVVEFAGSRQNNIVFRGPHGAGVFRDGREGDAARRYKMLFRGEEHMAVAYSHDALNWGAPVLCPEIRAAGDTHNNALWVDGRNKYVGFTRLWDAATKVRQVGWTHSADFEHWSAAEPVLQGDDPALQVYAMPVFPYAGVYLGLAALFDTRTDRTHVELAWSPDTRLWRRICPGTPLIPNGSQRDNCDWGCIYPAAYPVVLRNEIRLYYGASDGPHTGWRKGYLCLATLRPDGFAGYESIDSREQCAVTTAPLTCPQPVSVSVTADVEQGGVVIAAILDGAGDPLATAEPIHETGTDIRLRWRWPRRRIGIPESVQLRFTLIKAKLYAFSLG